MDRDIRNDTIPRRGAAEDDGLTTVFIPMLQHGQQVIPGTAAKVIRENRDFYGIP